MGAAAVVAGVLAQFEELLDVHVPGFQEGADRALALAALVDRDGGIVGYFQEGHHALRLAVGALDVGAQRTDPGPVVAQAAGVFLEQGVFLDRLVDAVQVVRHRGQVAGRELAVPGAGVEQGRRAGHVVEAGQHVVELDGALFAVDLVDAQAHGDAHEEGLRQLDAAFVDVQEVAVVQGLQAEVLELVVALGVEHGGQAGQVELGQTLVEQFGLDAFLDVGREVVGVAGGHLGLGDILAQHFAADRVEQQAGGDQGIVRVLFDQGAGRHDQRFVHLSLGHAVVQVAQGGLDDLLRVGFRQAFAGIGDQPGQALQIYRGALAVFVGAVQRVLLGLLLALLGPLLGTLFPIQHVGAGGFMFAGAHQRQFDLVLDVLDVEGAAAGLAPHQGLDHAAGQAFHQFPDPRRGRGLAAVHRDEGLGHGDGDLGRLENHDRAVAADDLVTGVARGGVGGLWRDSRCGGPGGLKIGGKLHPLVSFVGLFSIDAGSGGYIRKR